jgi:D-sedoheptulose 7-phosphate isomerase
MENRQEQSTSLKEKILQEIDESIRTKTLLKSETGGIEAASREISRSLSKGNKVLIFGNGGSAADSQHFAAELQGRYLIQNRAALPAIALTTDSSIMTAISNDMDFGLVFSRQVEALCKRGDVVLGISTSGTSKNVVAGLLKAKELGGKTIGLTGKSGGRLKEICDICICVPSEKTSRIQESHLLIEHILSMIVEAVLSKGKARRKQTT